MAKGKSRRTSGSTLTVPNSAGKSSIRGLLRQEGKFLHGTRGKPTRGPRGNKR